jgi:large subunit ribosomal protein LP0
LFPFLTQALRPTSVILMGKNTMMKRSIRLFCEQTGNDQWLCLIDELVGNVGIVFTSGDLSELREEIKKYQVGAPARFGVVAPNDVFVDAGSTGMDPSQTSFFQASTCLHVPWHLSPHLPSQCFIS